MRQSAGRRPLAMLEHDQLATPVASREQPIRIHEAGVVIAMCRDRSEQPGLVVHG